MLDKADVFDRQDEEQDVCHQHLHSVNEIRDVEGIREIRSALMEERQRILPLLLPLIRYCRIFDCRICMLRITVGFTCGSRVLHSYWLNTWAKYLARKFSTRSEVHEVVKLTVGSHHHASRR